MCVHTYVRTFILQVTSSVWIDVATKEITEDIDYSELEKLFSAEGPDVKKPNIGNTLEHIYIHEVSVRISRHHTCIYTYTASPSVMFCQPMFPLTYMYVHMIICINR